MNSSKILITKIKISELIYNGFARKKIKINWQCKIFTFCPISYNFSLSPHFFYYEIDRIRNISYTKF